MAVKQILVGKAGSSATPLTLIKGDSNTQIIEMIVDRYYGGVDLEGLVWSVTAENAKGASDEYKGIKASISDAGVIIQWKVTGTATAAVGITKFKLSGYAQDGGNVLIWQSGDYFIRINDTFEHVPGAETQAALTEVQKLIIYVDGELNKVIKAGTDAAEAAKAANKAADRANSVADGKNEGRITALEQFTTKPEEPYAVEGKLVQLDNFEGMPMNAVTRIEPVQAGSGDPYPGGGGKNLAEQIVYGYVTLDGNNAYVRIDNNSTSVIAGVVEGNEYTISCSATLDRFGVGKLEAVNPTNGALLTSYRFYGNQSSVHELHFTAEFTGTAFIYLKSTKDETAKDSLQIEIGSTATEFAPYANIRPISGRTGAKLTKCGKNLLKKTMVSGTQSGITFTINTDGSITVNGTATGDCYRTVCTDVGLPAGDYILSGCPTSGGSGKYILYFAPSASPNVTDVGHGANITVREGQTHAVTIKINKGVTLNNITFYPMIRKASETDGTYEPYQGETFTANFGQNVYGGTLDWGKGVLTVDRAIVTLTGTENSVERNTTENAHYIRYNYFGLTQSAIADGAFCSHFKTRLNTDVGDQLTNTFEIHSSILYPIFRVSASLYPTDDVWKSYLAAQKAAGTPVQVCYKLATPTTIQLTPAQLTALQGMNNIFCDAGETTVSGRKDILWLTSGLIEQIDTLKKAIISLGGNV